MFVLLFFGWTIPLRSFRQKILVQHLFRLGNHIQFALSQYIFAIFRDEYILICQFCLLSIWECRVFTAHGWPSLARRWCDCVCAYRRECVCLCASGCLISMRGHVLNAYCKCLGENRSQGSRSHAVRSGSADRGGGSRTWSFFSFNPLWYCMKY